MQIRKAQRSAKTRQRILDSSRDLFASRGYQATGIALICRQSSVSKGAFYYHFPRKQAVLLTILEEWLHALEPALQLWSQDDLSAPQTLGRAAGAAREIFRGDRRTARLLLEFWNLAGRDAAVAQAAREPYRRHASGLAELLRRGVAEGSLRTTDVEAGGRVLVSLAVGVLLSSLLDPKGADWENVLAQGASMLLDGITKES